MTSSICSCLSTRSCPAQADLIGAERDGKRDEKMRAKLHAAWLEQQDTARVEALLHGVKNGFRKKRSALDDEARAAPPLKTLCSALSVSDAVCDRGSAYTCEALHGYTPQGGGATLHCKET